MQELLVENVSFKKEKSGNSVGFDQILFLQILWGVLNISVSSHYWEVLV